MFIYRYDNEKQKLSFSTLHETDKLMAAPILMNTHQLTLECSHFNG